MPSLSQRTSDASGQGFTVIHGPVRTAAARTACGSLGQSLRFLQRIGLGAGLTLSGSSWAMEPWN